MLAQKDVSFELLVVDDASSEPAEELYRQIVSRGHHVVRQSANQGPGAARNRGAALARGEWLCFLDSDDAWLPDKLARHLASLEGSGLSIGQTEEIWFRDGVQVLPPKAHKITGGDLFERSTRAVCVSSSTVVLKRSLFFRHGGFDESLFVCEDYDLWLRISAQERFDFCASPLVVKYGGHPDQLSRALPAMDRFRLVALLKGLARETNQWTAHQRCIASTEAERKVRILKKGSTRRGMTQAVECCEDVEVALLAGAWGRALEGAWRLLHQWPIRPEPRLELHEGGLG